LDAIFKGPESLRPETAIRQVNRTRCFFALRSAAHLPCGPEPRYGDFAVILCIALDDWPAELTKKSSFHPYWDKSCCFCDTTQFDVSSETVRSLRTPVCAPRLITDGVSRRRLLRHLSVLHFIPCSFRDSFWGRPPKSIRLSSSPAASHLPRLSWRFSERLLLFFNGLKQYYAEESGLSSFFFGSFFTAVLLFWVISMNYHLEQQGDDTVEF